MVYTSSENERITPYSSVLHSAVKSIGARSTFMVLLGYRPSMSKSSKAIAELAVFPHKHEVSEGSDYVKIKNYLRKFGLDDTDFRTDVSLASLAFNDLRKLTHVHVLQEKKHEIQFAAKPDKVCSQKQTQADTRLIFRSGFARWASIFVNIFRQFKAPNFLIL